MSSVRQQALASRAQQRSASSGVNGTPAPKKRTALIIVIIVIVVVLIAVGIAIFLILRARKKTATTASTSGGTTGNGTPSQPSSSGSGGSNLQPGQCAGNGNCPINKPVCSTTTHTCVECEGSSGCTSSATCSNGMCCIATAPSISSVTPAIATVNSLTIVYTYLQKTPDSPNSANVKVQVQVQAPDGVVLGMVSKTATGTVTVTENELAIQNGKLFPGVAYQVVIAMIYDCGGATGLTTPFSSALGFIMPDCNSTLVPVTQGTGNTSGNPIYNGFVGMAIQFFTYSSLFDVGVIASTTSNIHPNLAEIYHADIALQFATGGFPFAPVPYPGAIGTTYYVRYYQISSSTCSSRLSSELIFNRTY